MDSKRLLHDIRGKPVTFVPGRKVISVAPGEWTSPFEGKGYEPLGYRDFKLGDDPRRINLPATARRGALTIVERVALRDFKIMVVIDDSLSMRVRNKMDIQLGAAALLLYSAWQSETTYGLAIRSPAGVNAFGMGIGSRHFHYLYRRLLDIRTNGERDYLKGTKRQSLSRCLPPNAMMVYCSDFLDQGGNLIDLTALKRSVQRYDFISVLIQDEFECSFPEVSGGSFIALFNPETGGRDEVWISQAVAEDIREVHEQRFEELARYLGTTGTRSIHLVSPDVGDIAARIDAFFRRRTG